MRVLPQPDSPVSNRAAAIADEDVQQPREQFAGVAGLVEIARVGEALEGLFLQSPVGFVHSGALAEPDALVVRGWKMVDPATVEALELAE